MTEETDAVYGRGRVLGGGAGGGGESNIERLLRKMSNMWNKLLRLPFSKCSHRPCGHGAVVLWSRCERGHGRDSRDVGVAWFRFGRGLVVVWTIL